MQPSDNTQTDKNLKPTQAAEYVGLTTSTLAKMRVRGDGPRYAKLGSKIIIYTLTDLDAWIESRKRFSTSE